MTKKRPDGPREKTVGAEDGPKPPFPIRLSGEVIKGFGRGSSELGCPTANLPVEGLAIGGHEELESGVYFGFAGLDFRVPPSPTKPLPTAARHDNPDFWNGGQESTHVWAGEGRVFPMVMSIGWNPYYKNTVRSVEVHVCHKFAENFYGAQMSLLILGFIRPEYDYPSMDKLVEDINTDIEVTLASLQRPAWRAWRLDKSLLLPLKPNNVPKKDQSPGEPFIFQMDGSRR